ncbi:MAG: DUF6448 family protein [Anaeromyxobacteraceae bacterium]
MKKSLLFVSLLLAVGPSAARAHCDTLDGPVVVAARAALESGKLEPVLAWVQPADEAEIRNAFEQARAVRKGGKEARELADTWFFETLVRVHRAGEGAPYTGLKPAGAVDPGIAAADRVIAGGKPAELEALLVAEVREGLHRHVARLQAEKAPGADVAAGRRWVAAYVPFIHWAEGVLAAARGPGGHGHGGAEAAAADHAGHSGAAPAAGHGEHAH